MRKKKIQETKKKILESLEDKKIVPIKLKFKSRMGLFWIKWKVGRNFPDYSLKKDIKELFFPPKLEVLLK